MSHAQDIVTEQKVATFTCAFLNTGGEVIGQPDLPMSYIHGVDGKMYLSNKNQEL